MQRTHVWPDVCGMQQINTSRLTGEHVRRCRVEEGHPELLAWPRLDGLSVEGAPPPRHSDPPLLEDGLVDDADDGDTVVEQRDQSPKQGLA